MKPNSTIKRENIINTLALLLIIIVGGVLRFYKYGSIQLTHDEFSTFFLSRYDDLKTLWYTGVYYGDSHPPFVHTLHYLIIKYIGEWPFLIKLPFTLMGLASVWLTYIIGKKWFSVSTGLYSAACISVMQIMVMYSQIARMYISGVFLSLCLIWFWHQFIFIAEKKKRSATGFILFGTLMAYNHHFTLLLAGIIGFSGLLSVAKKDLKLYILSGVCIFILYIPNLPILLNQFSMGGLSWLAKPGIYFLPDFLSFLFHYSWPFVLVIFALSAMAFYQRNGVKPRDRTLRLYCVLWFVIFFAISYSYSQWVSPILQFSIMIFVSPLLILFLFSFYKEQKAHLNLLGSIVILLVGSISLIYGRDHYRSFYSSHFLSPMEEMQTITDSHPNEVSIIYKSQQKILDHLYLEHAYNFDFISLEPDTQIAEVDSILKHSQTPYLVWAWSKYQSPGIDVMVKKYYPYLRKKLDLFNGELYFRSKTPSSEDIRESIFETEFNPENIDNSLWRYRAENIVHDSIYGSYLSVDSLSEFPLSLKIPQELYAWHRNENIEISIQTRAPHELSDLLLAYSPMDKGNKILWRGYPIGQQIKGEDGIYKDYYKYRFADFPRHQTSNLLQFDLWNPGKNKLDIINIKIAITRGNGYIYSHFEEIESIDSMPLQ